MSSRFLDILSVASIAGLVLSVTAPASAQTSTAVPNSATRITCANGIGSAASVANQDVSADQNVAGTPVTSLNPFGTGTTESATPLLTKPVDVTTIQCPHSPLSTANVSTKASAKAHTRATMNALSSNPNGATWLHKYSHRTKATYGGGS